MPAAPGSDGLLDDYSAMLEQSRPLIDVRSPIEFAQGAVPGAVNLPLLDDEERAAVGRTYKKGGREAAVALGYRLVDGETKRARLAAWRDFAARHPNAALCCWRGGLRSQVAQEWLAQDGIQLPRVVGGSKALRGFCLDVIRKSRTRGILLVGGRTGSGKTQVVRQVANHVDLEALANHRGSAFGARRTPQPTPVAFENALAVALLKLDANKPVVAEDESRTIGRLAIPRPLFDAMQRASIVLLQVDADERVENIYREYVLDAGHPREQLLTALARIERRLGGQRYQQIARTMVAAFDASASAAPDLHRRWIRCLLHDYYDPMYDYQLGRKGHRIVLRGTAAEATAYLAAEQPVGTPGNARAPVAAGVGRPVSGAKALSV